MDLVAVKSALSKVETLGFQLPNGEMVPSHFHVTEVGKVTKHFIDCGGTERKEEVVNFQLWNANDYDHRLHPEKLLNIISLSEKVLGIGNLEIEVEYQGETIQKFGLDFDGQNFKLTAQKTDCLAKDKCGIPTEKPKVKLANIKSEPCCSPEGNCC
uniref:DUF6428 family protein n=1 Tax=Flavobacterium sp. TaxID=239 RepID=UPI00404ABD7E